MKKLLFACMFFSLGLSSCMKDDNSAFEEYRKQQEAWFAQLDKDQKEIQEFLDVEDLPHERDEKSGLYYHVIEPGDGEVKYDERIVVKYKRTIYRLNNGEELFNSDEEVETSMGRLRDGYSGYSAYSIGIQHIQPGGKIIMYLPSGWAAGANSIRDEEGNITAGPNTNVKVELELIEAR